MPPLPRHISNRRFPPPWSVEELDACYVVVGCCGNQQFTSTLIPWSIEGFAT
jgi:hypothetical protein